MNEQSFWKIIELFDWNQQGDDDAVMQPACKALAAMEDQDIYKFEDILSEKLHALDTRAHCKACFAGEADPDNGNDYISADGFLYARCVAVVNGRKFYESILRSPSKMPQNMEFEVLLSLPEMAYELKSDVPYEHVPSVSYESFQNIEGWQPSPATRPGKFVGEHMPPGNRRPT